MSLGQLPHPMPPVADRLTDRIMICDFYDLKAIIMILISNHWENSDFDFEPG